MKWKVKEIKVKLSNRETSKVIKIKNVYFLIKKEER